MLQESSGTSVCRIAIDQNDPTGCGGLCALDTEACQLVDKARGVRVCRLLSQVTCSPQEWRCRNGFCVSADARCDGSIQCYDRSDEMHCDCDLSKQFRCGQSISCFSNTKLCDGVIDCWDGFDEVNCTAECPEDQFTCTNGQCILSTRFCDGLADCGDGSDEPNGCDGACNAHEIRFWLQTPIKTDMADSDDEYDRKRRDKFRGERGAAEGSSYRSGDRREDRNRGREEWSERSRGGRSGPDYRDYRGGASASRGYSPVRGEGPPNKRIRPEWPMEDRRYGGMPHDAYGSYGWGHDHFGPHPAHQGYGQPMPPVPARDAVIPMGPVDGPPTMMSFKAFLAAQDDSITVDDAIQKYNEYKLEFRRQQLNEFFVAHKDEECLQRFRVDLLDSVKKIINFVQMLKCCV
ncbi:unnamed protein product, partial [Iphiclides podalirius]